MSSDVRTIMLGAATVTVINVYVIPSNLDELVDAPTSERSQSNAASFKEPAILSVQCVYIQVPGSSILVDAGAYDASFDPGRPPYQPPPDLVAQLANIGVQPEDITHVVITHSHGDHYNATTVEQESRYEPMFPNARYYLGSGDWEQPRLQEALGHPDSLESRTLGVLYRESRLVLVEGNCEVGGGAQIVAAPGETPGHQILRLTSNGQTLYCLGDLYHHPVEVEHPAWTARWADREANLESRRALAEAALAENALLVATHIPGIGRLERTAWGVTWATV